MKTTFTLLVAFLISILTNAQNTRVFNFENENDTSYFDFTQQGLNKNIWQVGQPKKNIFISGYESKNALITDTTQSYPVNTNSSFRIHTYGPVALLRSELYCTNYILSGYYWVNSDTLADYGKIEFSIDSGKTYIDLLTDSRVLWNTPAPVLSGNSKQWKIFSVNLRNLISFGSPGVNHPIYRFTFTSDNIDTKKDGLMFDKITFCDLLGGLNDELNSESFVISPNPASEIISVRKSTAGKWSFEIHGQNGNIVKKSSTLHSDTENINISSFQQGMYEVILRNDSGQIIAKKRIIKL